jgi:glucose-1-phosphate cytidylyltransferase
MTGGRIKQIQKYVEGETFLATYGDGIADIDLNGLLSFHRSHGKIATLTVANPPSRFGVLKVDDSGLVSEFSEKPKSEELVNIGYFIFEPAIFDHLTLESVLEKEPINRLVSRREIGAFKHTGFWKPMDTQREYLELKEDWESGKAPWKKW